MGTQERHYITFDDSKDIKLRFLLKMDKHRFVVFDDWTRVNFRRFTMEFG